MAQPPQNQFLARTDADGCFHILWNDPRCHDRKTSQCNRMSLDALIELSGILDQILSGPCPPMVMLASGNKYGFGSGYSFHDLVCLSKTRMIEPIKSTLQSCCEKLGQVGCPTIAAISGACLGEALELAACCDYRIAYQNNQTRLGFHSFKRDFFPLPISIERICNLIGLERGIKLSFGNQSLDGKTAYRWGLVDSAPDSESKLRDAIHQIRGKALLLGKRNSPAPPNWVRRFMQSNAWCRSWITRGLQRWLSLNTPQNGPWDQFSKKFIQLCDETDQKSLSRKDMDKLWLDAAQSSGCQNSWHISDRLGNIERSQTNSIKPLSVGLDQFTKSVSPIIPPHFLVGIPIKIVDLKYSIFSKNMAGNSIHTNSNCISEDDTLLQNLLSCELAIVSNHWQILVPQPIKKNTDPVGITPFNVFWQAKSPFKPKCLLWGPFSNKTQTWGVLTGKEMECVPVAKALKYLGIHCTISEQIENSWFPIIANFLLETIQLLAQGIEPIPLDLEARKKGWLIGPCLFLQTCGMEHVSNILLERCKINFWNNQNTNELGHAFGRFVQKSISKQIKTRSTALAWMRIPKKGAPYLATGLNKQWQKESGIPKDMTLNSLPPVQRVVEALDRIERAGLKALAKLPQTSQTEGLLVGFHAMLGLPGWRLAELTKKHGLKIDLFVK